MKDFFIIFGCWAISFLIQRNRSRPRRRSIRHGCGINVKLNRPDAVRLDRLLEELRNGCSLPCCWSQIFADIIGLLLLTRFLVFAFPRRRFCVERRYRAPDLSFRSRRFAEIVVSPVPLSRALGALSRFLEITTALLCAASRNRCNVRSPHSSTAGEEKGAFVRRT